jgi:hypothetical protein
VLTVCLLCVCGNSLRLYLFLMLTVFVVCLFVDFNLIYLFSTQYICICSDLHLYFVAFFLICVISRWFFCGGWDLVSGIYLLGSYSN